MHVIAEEVIKTNFFGVLNVCNALFPFLQDHARVVNLSSDWGCLSYITNKKYQEKFLNKNLTIPELVNIMNDYVE
jgi:hypothetical protein